MGGQEKEVICRSCGRSSEQHFLTSVNVAEKPELKESVLNGELFLWTCPHCGAGNLDSGPFLYHDPEGKLLILLTGSKVKGEELPEGYTGRLVRSTGELIEKIKIFDSGLDDVVIEVCKYVSCHEIHKDVKMKFYRLNGADSEITLAYPENGNMELVEVGFRVYEDCAALVMRNPGIRESVQGLASVDSDWLSQFFA